MRDRCYRWLIYICRRIVLLCQGAKKKQSNIDSRDKKLFIQIVQPWSNGDCQDHRRWLCSRVEGTLTSNTFRGPAADWSCDSVSTGCESGLLPGKRTGEIKWFQTATDIRGFELRHGTCHVGAFYRVSHSVSKKVPLLARIRNNINALNIQWVDRLETKHEHPTPLLQPRGRN